MSFAWPMPNGKIVLISTASSELRARNDENDGAVWGWERNIRMYMIVLKYRQTDRQTDR